MTQQSPENILIIKLSALGDVVQALGPMAAIRTHHRDAHITVLTTKPYVRFFEGSGYADAVWVDERPSGVRVEKWWVLRRRLRAGGFTRVYDLQTSDRSSAYYRLFWPGPYPEWSGIAGGCSHPHANENRDFMHTIERQAEQLKMAGIDAVPPLDLSWAKADVARFGLPERFALLAPGGAPHRPAKRWSAERYAQLAGELAERNITPVVLGTRNEARIIDHVVAGAPQAVSLADQTEIEDLAVLARKAVFAVGNDTGPMHLIAAAGCTCVVLYSHESDPALCAQRGPAVTILREASLDQVSVQAVLEALEARAP